MKNKLALVFITAFGMIGADEPAVPVKAPNPEAEKFVKCTVYALALEAILAVEQERKLGFRKVQLAYKNTQAKLNALNCSADIINFARSTVELEDKYLSSRLSREEFAARIQRWQEMGEQLQNQVVLTGLAPDLFFKLSEDYLKKFKEELDQQFPDSE